MSKFLKMLSSVLLLGCAKDATFISKSATLEDVKIQPSQALEIAETHLQKHGTYIWRDQTKLETVIVRKGDSYYVKRSDFPAKTTNWYLHGAIRISTKDGAVTYTEVVQ